MHRVILFLSFSLLSPYTSSHKKPSSVRFSKIPVKLQETLLHLLELWRLFWYKGVVKGRFLKQL